MPRILRRIATLRLAASALVLVALALTLTDTSGLVPERVIDLLGYYTLQANALALFVWSALAVAATRQVSPTVKRALEYARAFATANLVLVAVIYWSMIAPLGLENGPQLVIVMIISHVITPVFAAVDYLVVGTRRRLPTRGWWWFLTVPTAWLVLAMARAYAGDWIPYEYLDPARGEQAIVLSLAWQGLLMVALTVATLKVRSLRTIPDSPAALRTAPPLPAGLERGPSYELEVDRAVA